MREAELKTRRVVEVSQLLTTVLSAIMVALLVSYGSDIKQISVLAYQVQKHDAEITELQRNYWSDKK